MPIQGNQEPPAQLLLDVVMAIAGDHQSHLGDQGLHVREDQAQHRSVAIELLLEGAALQPVG